MSTAALIDRYFTTLGSLGPATAATDAVGAAMPLDQAVEWATRTARATHERGNSLLVIGNGGSASIASHVATDYTKNGGMRTLAFNDGAVLTCLGNDLGYENVFAKQLEMHARPGDLLIAVSSSGRSPNILNGVRAGRERGCTVLTLSGFDADNPLRRLGDVNLYVANGEYGFVELTHMALLHAVLDLEMGWGRQA